MTQSTDVAVQDEKDVKIAEIIIRNPQITVESIAEFLGIPESTVSKRLADMLRERQLARIIEIRDWTAFGYPLRYRIDIKVNQRELRMGRGGPPEADAPKIANQKQLATYIKDTLPTLLPQEYKGQLIVRDVTILLGQQADLTLVVRAKDYETILEFVTNGLRVLGGVDTTMTSQEAWSCSDAER